MKQKLTVVFVAALLMFVTSAVQAQQAPVLKDALRLLSGGVVVCNVLKMNADKVIVQSASGAKVYQRKKVAAILLGTDAASGNSASSGSAATCTSFDVELTDRGTNKLQIIKTVRDITGLGLKESKDLVDMAPQNVKEGVTQSEANSIKTILEEAGATVTIKCAS